MYGLDLPRSKTSTFRQANVPVIAGLKAELSPSLAHRITDVWQAALDSPPMPPSAMLREAQASSAIEGIRALDVEVYASAKAMFDSPQANLIAANMSAIESLVDKKLSVQAVHKAHRTLMHNHNPSIAGAFRPGPVWIGRRGSTPPTATYVPPAPQHVPPLMRDLIEFVSGSIMHPVVVAAIAHAQFETIHPYIDGNGRTGRAIASSVLANAGCPVIPMSPWLERHREDYIGALVAYRTGDVEPIINVTLSALEDGVSWARSVDAAYRRMLAEVPMGARGRILATRALMQGFVAAGALTPAHTELTNSRVLVPAGQFDNWILLRLNPARGEDER